MQINNGTDSIVDEIDSLCDSDSTSYPIADKIRRVNIGLDEVSSTILKADGTWEFDDLNNTDLPIGTATLVNGQQDYSFASELLVVTRVEIKDSDGNWVKLTPFDQQELDIALEEFNKTDGMPIYYDKSGDSIFLYPAPATANVTLTAGLKVYFKRNMSKFTTSDTTKSPGFASPYHSILAYIAALPYCMKYKQDRVDRYERKVEKIKKEIEKFYGKRNKDVRKRIIARTVNAN